VIGREMKVKIKKAMHEERARKNRGNINPYKDRRKEYKKR
jgi:hypothetical protein